MSSIQRVAVLGASGPLGQFIVPALLQSGFDITVISRPGGHGYTGTSAKAVKVIEAAYDDLAALTAAFRDHDALVEAFNPAATAHKHTIVQAALAAEVTHLVTNEFGHDSFHRNGAELPVSASKIEAQRVLEEELRKATVDGKAAPLAWTAIITSTWYDFAIRKGFFPLNPATRTITRFGSGNQRTSITRAALVGKAVVAVLREPERFQNRPVYVASHTITTNELITLAKEIAPEKSWNVVDISDLEAFKQQGLHLWSEDRKNGEGWLHTQAFMMLSAVLVFDEHNRYGADFGEKLEPGWGESREEFKDHLKQLIEEVRK
ncbi:NAD(P)-binding protein [Stipitochalara longipes BDJ]|nr:NAD(P)-binding protein [Stipitochalara longipes BDJ]